MRTPYWSDSRQLPLGGNSCRHCFRTTTMAPRRVPVASKATPKRPFQSVGVVHTRSGSSGSVKSTRITSFGPQHTHNDQSTTMFFRRISSPSPPRPSTMQTPQVCTMRWIGSFECDVYYLSLIDPNFVKLGTSLDCNYFQF